ncbi:unnamed protein product [Fraxinus pennsylvanica]|uniref:Uncharacterized protein n=1 Tax=Fraxinus pennsylvanica TaxID=56036 RepID=A0AAD1YTY1_9LAMI|nr:unnamed protein product [Fraxinus pennsylvanica]
MIIKKRNNKITVHLLHPLFPPPLLHQHPNHLLLHPIAAAAAKSVTANNNHYHKLCVSNPPSNPRSRCCTSKATSFSHFSSLQTRSTTFSLPIFATISATIFSTSHPPSPSHPNHSNTAPISDLNHYRTTRMASSEADSHLNIVLVPALDKIIKNASFHFLLRKGGFQQSLQRNSSSRSSSPVI